MTQGALFPGDVEVVDVGDPDCRIEYHPEFLDAATADALFATLVETIPWTQRHIIVFGERHRVPRLEAWIGDEGADYGYSGDQLIRHDWPPELDALRRSLAATVGVSFTGVLANRYRTGADKVGWHADDEPELGAEPTIASVSLGATRRFRLRHRDRSTTATVDLAHGSLLVMAGSTQRRCVHELSSTTRPVGERVNLPFRRVGASSSVGSSGR